MSVVMYTRDGCPYCGMAKQLFESKGTEWSEINIDEQPERGDEMIERSGQTSVPQIFIGDTHIGGYDDLAARERAGELDALLGE